VRWKRPLDGQHQYTNDYASKHECRHRNVQFVVPPRQVEESEKHQGGCRRSQARDRCHHLRYEWLPEFGNYLGNEPIDRENAACEGAE
jgi:hypothetical protein